MNNKSFNGIFNKAKEEEKEKLNKCEYIYIKLPKLYGKLTLKIALTHLLNTLDELLKEYLQLPKWKLKEIKAYDDILAIRNAAIAIKILLIGKAENE